MSAGHEKRFVVVRYTGKRGRPMRYSGLVTEAHAERIRGELGHGYAIQPVRRRRCGGCRRYVFPNLVCVHCGCVARKETAA